MRQHADPPTPEKNSKTSHTVISKLLGSLEMTKKFFTHREAISLSKTAEGDLLAGRLGSPFAQLHTLKEVHKALP